VLSSKGCDLIWDSFIKRLKNTAAPDNYLRNYQASKKTYTTANNLLQQEYPTNKWKLINLTWL
jgi:hypothetical protein